MTNRLLKKFLPGTIVLLVLGFVSTQLLAFAQTSAPMQNESQPATANIAGTIVAVDGNAFTLEVGKGKAKETMAFALDGNTKLEGSLDADATAEVSYRHQEGKNVALAVRVTPKQ